MCADDQHHIYYQHQIRLDDLYEDHSENACIYVSVFGRVSDSGKSMQMFGAKRFVF